MKNWLLKLFVALAFIGTLAGTHAQSTVYAQAPQVSIGHLGNDYFAKEYGVKCDGVTDDGVKLNALSSLIAALPDKAGRIILPPGTCYFTGSWRLGPSTTPWGIASDASPGIPQLSITVTPPRAASIGFTHSSTTVTFTGTTLTSADVGNEIFYGTTDAAYFAYDARTVVPTPSYSCSIVSVNTSAHTAVCTPPTSAYQGTIASVGPVNTPVTMTSASTGIQSAFVTNDHDFTVTDSNDLVADHVGKTINIIFPALRAPLNLINQSRNSAPNTTTGTQPCAANGASGQAAAVGTNQGTWSVGTSYSTNARVQFNGVQYISRTNGNIGNTPPTYPTLSTASWYYQDSFLCQNGGNLKLKAVAAVITSVTDTKHGKFNLTGVNTSNSNWVGAFVETSHTTESNSGAYNAHEWCHALVNTACYFSSSLHLNHAIDYDAFTVAYAVSTGATPAALSDEVSILPYAIPLDTGVTHISVKGSGAYSTILKWGGLGSEPENAPAVLISRQKQFTFEDVGLYNSTVCGSCYDTAAHNSIGFYFGGLPGSGTQTFGFMAQRLNISNFGTNILLGDNLGGEMSDSTFNGIGVSYGNWGVRMAPGSFNTLDVKFHDIAGGFNKIGVEDNDGNLIIQNGSFSYNGIDFHGNGFGPFTISGMRSEGPGRFYVGNEPQVSIRDSGTAEPQGARATTGTVNCAPNAARNITLDLGADTGALPVGTFYGLTFLADVLTRNDLGKSLRIVLTDGSSVVGYLHDRPTSTTGILVKQYGTPAVEAGKNATVYDADTCDLTWASGQAYKNDVGGAFMLPNADSHDGYASLAKVYIDSVTDATHGIGHWQLGQGGPVVVNFTTPSAVSTALAGAGAGNVDNGAHEYFVTFVSATDETAPSTAASRTVVDKTVNGKVSISSVPLGPAGTTSRKLYRTIAGATGAANMKLLTTLADNTTTVYTDNTADSGLGANGSAYSRTIDVDPVFFDNIVIELLGGGYANTIDNFYSSSLIAVQGFGSGSVDITNSRFAATPIGGSASALPVRYLVDDSYRILDVSPYNIPAPGGTTGHSTGIQFTTTTSSLFTTGGDGAFRVNASNNAAQIYGGSFWPLPDVIGSISRGTFEILKLSPVPGTGVNVGHNYFVDSPASPVVPFQRLSRVKSLGEANGVDGRNLRGTCLFATSDTCTFVWRRNESITTLSGGLTNYNQGTREGQMTVDSGHFTIADVGKTICAEVTSSDSGTRTACGYITSLTDATHIRVANAITSTINIFSGIPYGPITAVVGENEPDGNYLPFLSCSANETFNISSVTSTGFTITSSNASSTARCSILIVR
jgi:hypothetical protein